MINIHATTISYKNKGIMIVGESGSGKSDLAFRMIMQKKAKLIADDRTEIEIKNGKIYAYCPDNIKNMIEVRGVGIVPMKAKKSVKVALVAELVDDIKKIERMPKKETFFFADAAVEKLKIYPFETSALDKLVIKVESLLD